jgi:hypothetical protein
MRLMTVLVASAVTALAAGQSALADNAFPTSGEHSNEAVYEGVDTDGKRVRLTISEGGPEVLIRVDRRTALPEPHWTALIGTGAAATVER